LLLGRSKNPIDYAGLRIFLSMPVEMDCRNLPKENASSLASAVQGGIVTARFEREVLRIETRMKLMAASTAPPQSGLHERPQRKRDSTASRVRKKVRKLTRKLLRRFGLAHQ
jgi:hypothetical protein